VMMWNGFIYLRIGTTIGFLWKRETLSNTLGLKGLELLTNRASEGVSSMMFVMSCG
jgi:hypothetical protein